MTILPVEPHKQNSNKLEYFCLVLELLVIVVTSHFISYTIIIYYGIVSTGKTVSTNYVYITTIVTRKICLTQSHKYDFLFNNNFIILLLFEKYLLLLLLFNSV